MLKLYVAQVGEEQGLRLFFSASYVTSHTFCCLVDLQSYTLLIFQHSSQLISEPHRDFSL